MTADPLWWTSLAFVAGASTAIAVLFASWCAGVRLPFFLDPSHGFYAPFWIIILVAITAWGIWG